MTVYRFGCACVTIIVVNRSVSVATAGVSRAHGKLMSRADAAVLLRLCRRLFDEHSRSIE